jgi:hypothetical protein
MGVPVDEQARQAVAGRASLATMLRLISCTRGANSITAQKATGQAAKKAWRQRGKKSACRPILSQVTQALISRVITSDIRKANTQRRRRASDMAYFQYYVDMAA